MYMYKKDWPSLVKEGAKHKDSKTAVTGKAFGSGIYFAEPVIKIYWRRADKDGGCTVEVSNV